jgi:7-carboxy-7-deazaguanine synthase
MTAESLMVASVLATVEGESSRAGYPCWLIRLAGCPLRCRYCDTVWAREGGELRSVRALVDEASDAGLHHVLVTGGEPLSQGAAPALLRALCDRGLLVALETSGALPTDHVDPRVRVVLDIKCPGSGLADRMCWTNLDRLRPHDEVKFVLTDRADYQYARDVIARHRLTDRVAVILSPAGGLLDPRDLAAWMVRDRVPARLGLQLHRLGWPDLG